MNKNSNWKSRLLLTGTLVGAVAGFATAYMMARDAENNGGELNLSSGDLMRAAPGIIAAMRTVSALGRSA